MAKGLVYGSVDPSSILAPFIDFLFFPLILWKFSKLEAGFGYITPLIIDQPLFLIIHWTDVWSGALSFLNEARMAEESGRRKRRRPTSNLASMIAGDHGMPCTCHILSLGLLGLAYLIYRKLWLLRYHLIAWA